MWVAVVSSNFLIFIVLNSLIQFLFNCISVCMFFLNLLNDFLQSFDKVSYFLALKFFQNGDVESFIGIKWTLYSKNKYYLVKVFQIFFYYLTFSLYSFFLLLRLLFIYHVYIFLSLFMLHSSSLSLSHLSSSPSVIHINHWKSDPLQC